MTSIPFKSPVTVVDGVVDGPSVEFEDHPDTGLYYHSGVGVAVDGVKIASIEAAGIEAANKFALNTDIDGSASLYDGALLPTASGIHANSVVVGDYVTSPSGVIGNSFVFEHLFTNTEPDPGGKYSIPPSTYGTLFYASANQGTFGVGAVYNTGFLTTVEAGGVTAEQVVGIASFVGYLPEDSDVATSAGMQIGYSINDNSNTLHVGIDILHPQYTAPATFTQPIYGIRIAEMPQPANSSPLNWSFGIYSESYTNYVRGIQGADAYYYQVGDITLSADLRNGTTNYLTRDHQVKFLFDASGDEPFMQLDMGGSNGSGQGSVFAIEYIPLDPGYFEAHWTFANPQYWEFVNSYEVWMNGNTYSLNDGDFQIAGNAGDKIGFWGATPVIRDTGWTASNVTPTKTFDVNDVTLWELAHVVGTLVDTMKTYGLLGGA